jgi:hypothetical protein
MKECAGCHTDPVPSSVCVDIEDPGKRPFFEKLRRGPMPLRIALLWDSLVLEEEMEKELQKSFGDGSCPLTRATLFHDRDRSDSVAKHPQACMLSITR